MSILSDISGFAEMRGIRADGGGGASSSSSTAENMRCDAAQYGFFGKAPMEELELGSLLEDGGVNGDGSGFGEPDDGGYQFSSVGEETVGMGAEAQSIPAAAKLFDKANDILGYDLLDLCTNGPKEKLDSTVISQPAIYVTSLAAVEVLRACDGGQDVINSVDVTCGLSLGEYTALAFAGAFSFEDGLKLVKLRGEAIQDASDAANSAMIKRLFPIRMAYES